LVSVLREKPGAKRAIFALHDDASRQWLGERAPWLAAMTAINSAATAYVCEHYQCHPPVTNPSALRSLLR